MHFEVARGTRNKDVSKHRAGTESLNGILVRYRPESGRCEAARARISAEHSRRDTVHKSTIVTFSRFRRE